MDNVQTIVTRVRKCGLRKEGGVYLVGGEGGSPDGVLARFTRLNPPIPYRGKFHRGPRIVDGFEVLNRTAMENWWLGSSKDTEEKKSADQWAIDTFGMTLTKRLETGECKGAANADDALAILVTKVAMTVSRRLVEYIQDMTLAKIQELPRVAPHHEAFLTSVFCYIDTHSIGHLVEAQAALWRMAYAIPPAKRKEYIPFLMRLLVLMNLRKDAMAMQRIFVGGGNG